MKYLEHIQKKPPHKRRTHALQLSLGLMVLILLGWVAMLPVRFEAINTSATEGNTSQTASIVNSQIGNATLLVATSSDGGGQ